MIKLNNFLMLEIILIQGKANNWVAFLVKFSTSAGAVFSIALRNCVGFPKSSPAWCGQSYESDFPVVIFCAIHQREVSVIFPNDRAGFAQIFATSAAPLLKSGKANLTCAQVDFLPANKEGSNALFILGGGGRGSHTQDSRGCAQNVSNPR